LSRAESPNDSTYKVITGFIGACLERNKNFPISSAADVISERVSLHLKGTSLDASDWTSSEQDEIELVKAGRDLLKCNIYSVRKAWLVRSRLTMCVGLEGCEPPDSDYEHLLGPGLLTKEEYRTIADLLTRAVATPNDIGSIFNAVSLSVISDGVHAEYEFESSRTGPGHILLTYRIEMNGLPPRAELHLRLSTIVSSKHAWYTYHARRTILERLAVRLTAEFEIFALRSGLWWCDPEHQAIEIGDGKWTSLVVVPGPVPVGTEIFWMLGTEGW